MSNKKTAKNAKPTTASKTSPGNAETPAGPGEAQAIAPDTDGHFPVIGIGASAGGLAAFEAFFSGMPADADPGMAFVLVQHLAPDHESILTDLIRRYTRMQVFEVEDGMVVRPNCAYIIPPNHDMAFLNGTLQLLEPSAPRAVSACRSTFSSAHWRSDQHERAIGIVLSGTGSDGTEGLRAIKGQGGMIMAQTPESADFDGMPRSAIATGLVDYTLPPAEMAARLITYTTHVYGNPPRITATHTPETESALKKIFVLLRAQTSHDFSQYKPSTINRRIERRMVVQQIENIDDYVRYLQQSPPEAEALFRDLLIGVTNFFRDPEAFGVLEEQVIPKLFADKPAGAVIRIWSTGCSTGEEAYSLAILMQEHMERLKKNFTVQIFATDIDSRAIATARRGLYPAIIAADITPERLARFFSNEPGSNAYRIHKGIRDLLIFSEQDVIKDPPFSKLDLISCRNMLIYMDNKLQKKLIPLFHYALKPGGTLFLGTSEGIGESAGLFAALDRKAKIYQRKEDLQGAAMRHLVSASASASASTLEHMHKNPSPLAEKTGRSSKLPLRELTEQALLQQIVPASVLVNAQGDILYLHGRTGMYLEPAPGEAGISNILKMARDGLGPDLNMALHKAVGSKALVRRPGLNVKTNGHFTLVNLTVCPVVVDAAATPPSYLYLVILDNAPLEQLARATPSDEADAGRKTEADVDACILALQQELRAKDEYLQCTHEELESANEELKSSNEEMQSVNEELQSTNEELETSKEELQSVNEELATVNTELQTKVLDLSRANNDMNNLLAGTGIATVFVDHQLRILRFTPTAHAIINLIDSDIGRPVAHIASNLIDYTSLIADIQSVLNTLIPKAVDVEAMDGKWYTLRIQPYRTLDNVIEGAVITFADITERVEIREVLKQTNSLRRLAVIVSDAYDAMTVQDFDGQILTWNPGAARLYGWSEAEALAMNVRELIPQEQQASALKKVRELSQSKTLQPYTCQRITKNGTVINVWMTATALLNKDKQIYAIATTERGESRTDQPGGALD